MPRTTGKLKTPSQRRKRVRDRARDKAEAMKIIEEGGEASNGAVGRALGRCELGLPLELFDLIISHDFNRWEMNHPQAQVELLSYWGTWLNPQGQIVLTVTPRACDSADNMERGLAGKCSTLDRT